MPRMPGQIRSQFWHALTEIDTRKLVKYSMSGVVNGSKKDGGPTGSLRNVMLNLEVDVMICQC
jgi:hypothetical protein